MQEIEKKYTAEKLRLNMNIKMGDKLPVKNIETYRNVISSFDESANDEENEDQDEENESDN